MVPRRCRWPLRAKSSSPALDECIGRGPTGFRDVAGKIRPVTGTCRKTYINTKRIENNQDVKTYDAYRLTSWCAGFPHPRRTSDGEPPSIPKDPTRIRADLVPPFWARMQKYHRGRWYHDAAGGLCRLNLDLPHWLSALEEVRLVSEPWRERYGL